MSGDETRCESVYDPAGTGLGLRCQKFRHAPEEGHSFDGIGWPDAESAPWLHPDARRRKASEAWRKLRPDLRKLVLADLTARVVEYKARSRDPMVCEVTPGVAAEYEETSLTYECAAQLLVALDPTLVAP